MAETSTGLIGYYDYYWNKQAAKETNDLPLIGSIIQIPLILLAYLYFVLKCGPRYMKGRKPYSLKTFVKCYNVFQIVANAFAVQQLLSAGLFTKISMFCRLINHPYASPPYKVWHTFWIVLILKLIDLVETMVFVLRKKNNQVSFLHLYHHVSTVVAAWFMTKYVPLPLAAFTALINSSVHVLMYTYYFLSAFGEDVQKMINPYKRYLTIIQMVQFLILLTQYTQFYFSDCSPPMLLLAFMFINIVINLTLFTNFYVSRYIKPAQKTS